MVKFVEQADGTTVEVKQRKSGKGVQVKNEAGGRVYRVVSDILKLTSRHRLLVQITREYMAEG